MKLIASTAACFALMFLAGCTATPTKVAGVGASTATAIVCEADDVYVTAINGTAIKGKFKLFPTMQASPRWEVPAGACELRVEFGNANFRSVPKTLRFTAITGHTYVLNSRVTTFHGGTLQNDQWDARLKDDANKTKDDFVAKTTDMKP